MTTIPWAYTDSPGTLLWTWQTPHFIARIIGARVSQDGHTIIRCYSWEIGDLIRTHQGMPRILVEGDAESFEAAEALVQEHIGKSYHSFTAYREYVGAAATTFTLTTGAQIDVTDLIGTTCTAVVRQSGTVPGGETTIVTGEFSLHGYLWHLRTGLDVIEIRPEHVEHISNRSDAAQRASAIVSNEKYTGIGRMYRSEWTPGCTGMPGFDVGIVDHAGASTCPIHERTLIGADIP